MIHFARRSATAALFALGLTLPTLALAQGSPAPGRSGVLPKDTLLYLEVREASGFAEAILGLPLVKADAARPQVARGYAELTKGAGPHEERLKAALAGLTHIRLAVTQLALQRDQDPVIHGALFLGGRHLDALKAFAAAEELPLLPKGDPIGGLEVLGMEKRVPLPFYLVQTADELIIATDRALLASIVAGLASPPAESLATTLAFQAATKDLAGQRYWGYVDAARFITTLQDVMPVEPEQRALLERARSTAGAMGWGARYSKQGAVSVERFVGAQHDAVSSAFLQTPGSMTLPSIAPAGSAVVVDFRIGDLAKVWKAVVTSVRDVEPEQAAEIDRGVAELEGKLGMTLAADVFPIVRGEVAVFAEPSLLEGSPAGLAVAVTTDRAKLGAFLARLEKVAAEQNPDAPSPFQREKGADYELLRVGDGSALLIADGYTLFGPSAEHLLAIHAGALGRLAESPRYQAAVAELPKARSKLLYMDGRAFANLMADNLVGARKGANESAAIATCRTLVTVQTLFRDGDKDGDGEANYASSLEELASVQLIDPTLASGVKHGYRYEVGTAEDPRFGWWAKAVPLSPEAGRRSFWVNEIGVIRWGVGDVSETSPPIGGGSLEPEPAPRDASGLHPQAGAYVNADRLGFALVTVELADSVELISNLPVPLFSVTPIVAAIAIPNLVEARKGANESAAIATCRVLTTVQTIFRDGDKDRDGEANYATSFAELQEVGLIDPMLGSGTKQGYRYVLEVKDKRFGWSVTATPLSPSDGGRAFYVDETGIIRFERAGVTPTAKSRAIGF